MQITSKALQLNFWQHKTRQGEIFTNTKSWKYGECKHCRPLVTKAGCSWGARVAFWCRIEVLLATRILAFIPKWCKAIERKANYVQKWCQLNKLLASYYGQNFFPSNTFWIKTKTKKKIQALLLDKTCMYTCMRLVGFIVSVTWWHRQLFCEINHKITASSNLAIITYQPCTSAW